MSSLLHAAQGCLVVAPRLPLRLGGRWDDTTLPCPAESGTTNTGERVSGGITPLKTLLQRFPVALLSSPDALRRSPERRRWSGVQRRLHQGLRRGLAKIPVRCQPRRRMREIFMAESDPLWYKDAIIYELHVEAFFDSNDRRPAGDFPGPRCKLRLLCRIWAITCPLALLPSIHPPLRARWLRHRRLLQRPPGIRHR